VGTQPDLTITQHLGSLFERNQIPPVVRRAMHGTDVLNILDETDRKYPAGLGYSVASELSYWKNVHATRSAPKYGWRGHRNIKGKTNRDCSDLDVRPDSSTIHTSHGHSTSRTLSLTLRVVWPPPVIWPGSLRPVGTCFGLHILTCIRTALHLTGGIWPRPCLHFACHIGRDRLARDAITRDHKAIREPAAYILPHL
jgi:hypothetical protein